MQPTSPFNSPTTVPVPSAPPAQNTHVIAGAALLLAALLMLVGVVTKSVVSASWDEGTESIHIGLFGAEICNSNDGGCRPMEWGQMRDVPGDIKAVRLLAILAGFASVGIAVVAGALAFQRKRIPPAVVHAVLGVAAFAFSFFIVRWIGEGKGEVQPGPGWSAMLVFAGLILASVIQATMLKRLR